MSRKFCNLLSLFVIVVLFLTACGQAVPTTSPADQQSAAQEPAAQKPAAKDLATEAPAVKEPTATASAEPAEPQTSRKGGWADTIVYTSINTLPDAVAQLKADAVDVYAYGGSDRDAFQATVDDPNLQYAIAYGNSVRAFMFNPAGPTFQDGRLNPFSNPKIREACNWLIDRKYIAQESIGPMGMPQTVVLISAMPDYVRYADLIRPLEAKYAYNFDKAKEAISAEMTAMGATMGADGKWQFNGAPVTLVGLIRSEDDRTMMGNYFSDQLEKIGFTVDRQVRTRTELSPIWGRSDPTQGQWSFYTGGWGYNSIARNAGNLFDGYYNPRGGSTTTEQAYVVSPEFDKLSLDLANNNFKTMDERREMFAKALGLSLKESQVVWVAQGQRFYPMNKNIKVAADLTGGVDLSALTPYTMRWDGKEGGTIRVATSGILTGHWNPIAGQDWVQEIVVQKNLADDATLADPYTGLYWPQRLERAEVVVKEGLPMGKTLDWVDLKTAPEITVPIDAWADWDAKAQKWITVGEKYPNGTDALTKITVYYPKDLYSIKWHDGSNLSVGDFIVHMIEYFDLAKPDSPVYDEAQVPSFESFMSYFKGVRIVSTDPLVIETYVDTYDLDAEVLIGGNRWANWFPLNSVTGYYEISWHSFTIGMLAEANKELAFSEDKSTALNVEWTHYVDGPSLDILNKYLDQAAAEKYIPYAPTAGKYITPDEAATRYANLKAWYEKHHHFTIGTGPYYLDQVNSIEGSLVIKNNPDFPDSASKWTRFDGAKMPVLDASGPSKITIGKEATFDVLVSFKDEPYPTADMQSVLFLLYDTEGSLVDKGEAELVTDGQYALTLTPEMTAKLKEGSAQIEVIGVSNVVTVPVFTTVTFVAGQ
jgi:peptide/nickel transport system substrate-binding protein